jgi:integrase
VVLELLYGLGLRRSEAAHLRVEQVHFALGQIHILGKGQRWRVLPLYPRLEALLKTYLKARAELSPTHAYLLCTDKGDPIYPKLIYRIVRRYLGTHPACLTSQLRYPPFRRRSPCRRRARTFGTQFAGHQRKSTLPSPPSQTSKEAYLQFQPPGMMRYWYLLKLLYRWPLLKRVTPHRLRLLWHILRNTPTLPLQLEPSQPERPISIHPTKPVWPPASDACRA